MKKQRPLNPKVARQIEILQKYYDIDIENRIINFVLYYEKASDILVNDVTTLGDTPRFNNDVLRRVSEILDTFPIEFKVNLSLQIDDYEGYSADALLDSLKDALEMFNYEIYRDKGIRWFSSAMLVFVSMVILFLRITFGQKGFIDTEGMLYEMLDIIAWVFLWQAVTVLFLTPKETRQISYKIMMRLLSIGFKDKDLNDLVRVEGEEIDQEWHRETKKEKYGRIFMLIGGTAFVTIAVMTLVSSIESFSNAVVSYNKGEDGLLDIIEGIFTFISVFIFAIGGIGAISTHRGKGPFRKAVKVFAILSFIVVTLSIALVVFEEVLFIQAGLPFSAPMLFSVLLSVGGAIVYFLGYILLRISTTDSSNLVDND